MAAVGARALPLVAATSKRSKEWAFFSLPILWPQYSQRMDSRATQQCNMCLRLCSLLAATSQSRVSIGQKMHLTGWENANNMHNVKCAGTQSSMEWPYYPFLYCGFTIPAGFTAVARTLIGGGGGGGIIHIFMFCPTSFFWNQIKFINLKRN